MYFLNIMIWIRYSWEQENEQWSVESSHLWFVAMRRELARVERPVERVGCPRVRKCLQHRRVARHVCQEVEVAGERYDREDGEQQPVHHRRREAPLVRCLSNRRQ